MEAIKVQSTEKLKTSYGKEVIVTEGRLVFLKTEKTDDLNPLIISDTEELVAGKLAVNTYSGAISNVPFILDKIGEKHCRESKNCATKVVLVQSEDLSKKHFQAIRSGKLRNGQKLYLECWSEGQVKYNSGGNVIIHPLLEKTYTEEEYQVGIRNAFNAAREIGDKNILRVKPKYSSFEDYYHNIY